MQPSLCPSEQQLQAFQLGDLPEPQLSDVADHLERCRACETMAQRLDTKVDSILAAIRNEPSSATPVTPSWAQQLPTRYVGPPGKDRAAETYSFLEPALQPDEIGRLGHYRVLRLLGRGGMGYVFHAEDIALQRAVA